jgi:hypothetical protein
MKVILVLMVVVLLSCTPNMAIKVCEDSDSCVCSFPQERKSIKQVPVCRCGCEDYFK